MTNGSSFKTHAISSSSSMSRSAIISITVLFFLFSRTSHAFSSPFSATPAAARMSPSSSSRRVALAMSTSTAAAAATTVPSWNDLLQQSRSTETGRALVTEADLRSQGKGSPHVHNTLRLFSKNKKPSITLFRDTAGWCPYCEKTMLLVEEKQIPIQIELINMRSYGDKPREFLLKVPNGLLPAIQVNDGQVITESSVIMELLDQWHTEEDGYKPMLPSTDADIERYDYLAQLERQLFSKWCGLLFRPEGPSLGGMLDKIKGSSSSTNSMSGSMKSFMDCIQEVNDELESTSGPWFFDDKEYPTMIDFVYISHVERMLASCAYWKGLNLRDPKWNFKGLNAWLDAFDKREPYLAFKSDYYTNVKDIPPQYGPGYDGGFEQDRQVFSNMILGKDGSWTLPLDHDDPLQPLYRGPPLPLAVLKAMDLQPDADGTYESCDPIVMAKACRHMAAWKLSDNGNNVSRFAARGGPQGAKNPRKTFAAQLADPYADPDDTIRPAVDAALRVVCAALLSLDNVDDDTALPSLLAAAVPKDQVDGVVSSLTYLRDRVGVPRDLPLASARYLRAYLNWAIDTLKA